MRSARPPQSVAVDQHKRCLPLRLPLLDPVISFSTDTSCLPVSNSAPLTRRTRCCAAAGSVLPLACPAGLLQPLRIELERLSLDHRLFFSFTHLLHPLRPSFTCSYPRLRLSWLRLRCFCPSSLQHRPLSQLEHQSVASAFLLEIPSRACRSRRRTELSISTLYSVNSILLQRTFHFPTLFFSPLTMPSSNSQQVPNDHRRLPS